MKTRKIILIRINSTMEKKCSICVNIMEKVPDQCLIPLRKYLIFPYSKPITMLWVKQTYCKDRFKHNQKWSEENNDKKKLKKKWWHSLSYEKPRPIQLVLFNKWFWSIVKHLIYKVTSTLRKWLNKISVDRVILKVQNKVHQKQIKKLAKKDREIRRRFLGIKININQG